MPLILPGNVGSATATTGYDVANSLRFNDGSSDYLNNTSVSSVTSRFTFTISLWVKRSTLGAKSMIGTVGGDSTNFGAIWFDSSDRLNCTEGSGGGTLNFITNRLFRDVSAWFHIVLAIDTTQSTESNRVKIYVNGVQETSFSTSTYPPQNSNMHLNRNGKTQYIGRHTDSTNNYYFDGYITEVVWVDGQQLSNTDLGEFDSDSPNIWKPIDVSGLTFGNNGFYLDFENSGSLGADVSGNSNNFTVNNLTSLDQTTDTCTNNFATIDTLSTNLFDPATTTFSEGNLKYVASNANFNGTWLSNIGVNAGKWYAEFKLGSHSTNSGHSFGIYRYDDTGVNATGGDVPVSNMIRIIFADSSRNVIAFGSTVQTGLSSTSSGDIFGIYMDIDNGKLNVQKNGSDYITEITGITTAGSTFFFQTQGEVQSRNLTFEHNYGNPTFSISSGNSDPEGFGNFEFSTTHNSVDYFALCTKNLAEYG